MTIGKCYAFTDFPAFEELNERERKFSIRSGRLLRHIREARNLSRKQLGMAADISHQQIYKYEIAEYRLSSCRLAILPPRNLLVRHRHSVPGYGQMLMVSRLSVIY